MNYEIGDVTYSIENIDYIGNCYHYEKIFHAFDTVKEANPGKFSHNKDQNLTDVYGMEYYRVYNQQTGYNWNCNTPVVNVTKNKEKLKQIIEKQIEKELEKVDQKTKEEIARLEGHIKSYQAMLNDVKEHGIKTIDGKHRMKDFLVANKEKLFKLVDEKASNS